MKYLLDTHIILWWLTEPSELSLRVRKILQNKDENIYISAASFWEMAIKKSIGRLKIPSNLIEHLTQEGFGIIPIGAHESLMVADLPMFHQDPFDRLLIVQAKLNDMIFVTRDKQIMKYPLIILKA